WPQTAVEQRLARPHVDLPEGQLHAEALQHRPDEVVVSHGGASDGHQNIGIPGRFDMLDKALAIVPRDAKKSRICAGLCEERRHSLWIGRDDLTWAGQRAR